MTAFETVYATHNFNAENEDEISLRAGEVVIVLEKDEGYQDGWWRGRNARGEIGLFPMNYVSTVPPGVSSLEQKIGSLEQAISSMRISPTSQSLPAATTNGIHSSQSQSTPLPSRSTGSLVTKKPSVSKSNLQSALTASLQLPALENTNPEDWSIDQVVLWLDAMGYDDVSHNFRRQEITGDVLLELTLESLKELDIGTFGKRFKIHNAIQALCQEMRRRQEPDRQILKESNTDQYNGEPTINSQQRSSMRSGFHDTQSSNAAGTINSAVSGSSSGSATTSSLDYVSSAKSDQSPNFHMSPSYSAGSSERGQPLDNDHATQVSRNLSIRHPLSTYPQADLTGGDNKWQDGFEKRAYIDDTMSQHSNHSSSRKSFLRGSFLRTATSKPDRILSVSARNSMDTVAQRNALAGGQGLPDMEGWLHKQSDKYRTWNKRWFVLKGPNLLYFKGPKELRVKGIINLVGYRIIIDETIHPSKYCFKAQHDRERTFYFYTDSEKSMKSWIHSLMKATITRNYNEPVLSSSTVPTVPLDVARRMKPRPPSVLLQTSETKNQYTSGDFLNHPSFEDRGKPIMKLSRSDTSYQPSRHSEDTARNGCGVSRNSTSYGRTAGLNVNNGSNFDPYDTLPANAHLSTVYDVPEEDEDLIDPQRSKISIVPDSPASIDQEKADIAKENGPETAAKEDMNNSNNSRWSTHVQWVNQRLDTHIDRLKELQTGEMLIMLLERISGKPVRRSVGNDAGSASMQALDNIVACFRFMGREGVRVDGSYTIKDVFNGNEDKIALLVETLREWEDSRAKLASSLPSSSTQHFIEKRNTFGGDEESSQHN